MTLTATLHDPDSDGLQSTADRQTLYRCFKRVDTQITFSDDQMTSLATETCCMFDSIKEL
jgi:hypothetical protein